MRKQKNKRQQPPNFKTDTARQLQALARKLVAHPDDPRAEQWDANMASLIEKALVSGWDRVLNGVINGLAGAGHIDAAKELRDSIGFYAALRYDVLASLDQKGALDSPLATHLFAIPVVIASDKPITWRNGEIPLDQDFSDLVRSFRRAGLVPPSDSISLENYLYHPEELLDIRWSQALLLADHVWASAGGKPVPSPKLFQRGWPRRDEKPTAVIRFLVGVQASDLGSEPFFVPGDGADETARDAAMTSWSKSAEDLVQRFFHKRGIAARCAVLDSDYLFASIQDGLSDAQDIFLRMRLEGELDLRDISAEDSSALIAVHSDNTGAEFRISILDQRGSFVGGAIRPILPFESEEEASEAVFIVLEGMGCRDLSFADEIFPRDIHCECCGEPTFLVPDGSGSPDQFIRKTIH